jgi:hypothetical protein
MEPVNDIERAHHRHGGPHPDDPQEGQRPYWRAAHRDWRVWVGPFLCLAAIVNYVLSEDLSCMPGGRPRHAQADTVRR